jgi:hypothetical protein
LRRLAAARRRWHARGSAARHAGAPRLRLAGRPATQLAGLAGASIMP